MMMHREWTDEAKKVAPKGNQLRDWKMAETALHHELNFIASVAKSIGKLYEPREIEHIGR
jgi:hypothetical protein